jgi:hypothetical protein
MKDLHAELQLLGFRDTRVKMSVTLTREEHTRVMVAISS